MQRIDRVCALMLVAWLGVAAVGGCARLRPQAPSGAARVILVQPGAALGQVDASGCGDRLLAVWVAIPGDEDPLASALRALLQRGDVLAARNGLYNALSQSDLQLESIETLTPGTVRVRLVGQLRIAGTCDAPRIMAQIERTALQYPDVRQVTILVNGIELSELLSTR